jgi:YgiT-type zinc finger domain-containing protein
MICLICRQAELVDGLTAVHFERDEMRLVVNNVPAQICPSCDEAYVTEEVTVQLLRQAQIMSEDGIREKDIKYGDAV